MSSCMSEKCCHYHSNSTATNKCSKCGKYVCLECIQKISGKSTSMDLCPECYYSTIMKSYSGGGFIIFIIIGIMLLIFDIFAWTFGVFPGIWGLFMLSMLIFVAVYIIRVQKPKDMKKAKSIKEKALAAKANPQTKGKTSKKQVPIYCHFCGAPLKSGEQTCKYCGMSWRWQQ